MLLLLLWWGITPGREAGVRGWSLVRAAKEGVDGGHCLWLPTGARRFSPRANPFTLAHSRRDICHSTEKSQMQASLCIFPTACLQMMSLWRLATKNMKCLSLQLSTGLAQRKSLKSGIGILPYVQISYENEVKMPDTWTNSYWKASLEVALQIEVIMGKKTHIEIRNKNLLCGLSLESFVKGGKDDVWHSATWEGWPVKAKTRGKLYLYCSPLSRGKK